MHSIFSGVVKDLFHFWFELKGPFSLKSQIDAINKRLKQITPPQFIQSAPRTIGEWKNWRSHELMSFILYYAFIVFYEIMEIEYLNHLKCLIIPLEILSMRVIKKSDLIIAEKLLIKFVSEIKNLYSESLLKSGTHELVNLCDMSLKFGPLNISSLYQYEELNRKINSFIKGFDLVGEEFIKIFTLSQNLTRISQFYKDDDEFKSFIDKYCKIKSSNRKVISYSGVRYTQSPEICKDKNIIEIIKEYNILEIIDNTIFVRYRLIYNNNIFTSYIEKYIKNRFGNYCILDKMSNKYGLILKFISINERVYVLCKKLVFLHNPFYVIDYQDLKSKLFIASLSNQIFVTEIQYLSQIFFHNYKNNIFFLSLLNTNHLFK